METGTVRLVGVATVGGPAVIPVPLNVTTEAVLKCVNWPLIVTERFCWGNARNSVESRDSRVTHSTTPFSA